MSNIPTHKEKSFLNSHFDQTFLKSTLVFGLILILGFIASLGFSKQADIAKAFIPPQPLKNISQIQSTICYNQSGSTAEISRGDFISCQIKLVAQNPELNISDFQYNAVLASGSESTSKDLIGSSNCTYNDSEQLITCLNIPTESIAMRETRNIWISVSDLNKKEVSLFNTGVEVLIN